MCAGLPCSSDTFNQHWNPSNMGSIGTEESVLIREVSLFQGLNYMLELHLGKEKVYLLERCPYFRGW